MGYALFSDTPCTQHHPAIKRGQLEHLPIQFDDFPSHGADDIVSGRCQIQANTILLVISCYIPIIVLVRDMVISVIPFNIMYTPILIIYIHIFVPYYPHDIPIIFQYMWMTPMVVVVNTHCFIMFHPSHDSSILGLHLNHPWSMVTFGRKCSMGGIACIAIKTKSRQVQIYQYYSLAECI